MPRAKIDRTDFKYGKLTVIKYSHSTQGVGDIIPVRHFLCKCECGNITTKRICNLVSGNTKSCGCLRLGRKPTNKNKEVKVEHKNEKNEDN